MSHPQDAFTTLLHPEIKQHLAELAGGDDPLLERMEAYAASRGFPLVGRDSGRWLELLSRMVEARRVFEFGSGWGYSAFFFARAVGEGGEVWGAEKDAWELEAHRELYAAHPLRHRIFIQHGDAFEVWEKTPGVFDVVFIDLHKEGYLRALRAGLSRLRPGGLILADNVLWGGKVARLAEPGDLATVALQEFNRVVFSDLQLEAAILPAGDGLLVARKKR